MASNAAEKSMLATTENFLDAFNGEWSVDKAMAPRAPECTHTTLTKGMDFPTRSNSEWEAWFRRGVGRLIKESKMTLNEWTPKPEEHRATAKSSLTAMSPVGPYSNRYTWWLAFNQDGTQITKIEEEFDADAAKDLLKKLKDAGLIDSH